MNRAVQGAAGSWPIGRVDTRIGWILGFAAILTFYLATTPENRTEAIDAYTYAYDAKVRALTDLYDTRLLLFHVVMRLLYRAAHAIHSGVTAHGVMLTVSALCASLCLVLFARLLNRHFGLSLSTSLLGAGFLGATYGFWRYSVEAEVYVPSLFLIMAVVSLVFAVEDRFDAAARTTAIVPAGVLAGLTVLFYQPNAIPLFLALPVLFLRRGGFPRLIAYGAAGGGTLLLGYVIAFLVDEGPPLTAGHLYDFVFERMAAFSDNPRAGALAAAIPALGNVIVSGNWVFGIPKVAAAANEIMPFRDSAKKVFAASDAGVLLVYVPLFTLLAVMALGAFTTFIGVWRTGRRPLLNRRLAFALTWYGLYAIVVGRLSPANYEVWLMTVPPLVIVFAAFVIEPCVRAGRGALPAALLAALVLHNAIGGIGIVYGAGGDYYRAKAAWVLDNATADDLILLVENGGFGSFLCYVSGLRVVAVGSRETCLRGEPRNVAQLLETTRAHGGRIFFFDELLDSSIGSKAHVPRRAREALVWAERFRGREQAVFQSDVGTTYQLR